MALTPKQQAFVREYLVDLNATQAAIRAGYSKNGASVTASKLLAIAKVRAEIDKAKLSRAQSTELSAEFVLRELKKIAESDPAGLLGKNGYLLPLNEVPEDVRKTISSVEMGGDGGTRIKFWSKTQALDLLGKHLKLFTDKTELSGPDGEPLTVKVVSLARGSK